MMQELSWQTNYPKHAKWDAKLSVNPLYAIMDEAVKTYPNSIATDFLGVKTTYKELGEQVNKAAEGFRQAGIKKGDTVGILLPNSAQFIASYYGALKAGAKVVALSPLDSAQEVAGKIEDSEAKIVVTMDNPRLYPLVEPLVGKGQLGKLVVTTVNDALGLPNEATAPSSTNKPNTLSWTELLDNKGIAAKDIPAIDPEKDLAVLQYTGGTTGKSKGAMLTHQNLNANVQQSNLWFGNQVIAGKDKMMGVLPFFHIFAMTTVMNFSIRNGLEIIVHPMPDPKAVLKDVHEKKPALLPAVPTLLDQMMNDPDIGQYDLTSLKASISGGMPLADATGKAFKSLTGGDVIEGYGLTEASPIVAANYIGDPSPNGVGMPYPGTTIQMRDMDDPSKILAEGETGEICVSGPQVMQGYWKDPEATRDAFTADGFLLTGDIGHFDEKGHVVISGRRKEMIISGGFKIYPNHLENALKDHPAVKDAAVIAIPDAVKGEVPKAFIVLHDHATTTIEELADYMDGLRGEALNAYEKVGEFEIVADLPKTPIGKIDKKALVKREAERAEQVEHPANVEQIADWKTRTKPPEDKKAAAQR